MKVEIQRYVYAPPGELSPGWGDPRPVEEFQARDKTARAAVEEAIARVEAGEAEMVVTSADAADPWRYRVFAAA